MGQGNDLNGILFEPPSTWSPPNSDDLQRFANLATNAKQIGFDTETRDPNLRSKGPGSFRRDGYCVGISLGAMDEQGIVGSIYLPIQHLAGGNLDRSGVAIPFAKSILASTNNDKIGCETLYDIEWLHSLGIEVKGRIHDIAHAEALLDEESETGYSLDAISRKYLGIGKAQTLLAEACTAFNLTGKGEMWKLHSKYVGPYAEVDAINPLLIHAKQNPLLEAEDLTRVYDMECKLTPIVWEMRKKGVKVDLEKAEALSTTWNNKEAEIRYQIIQTYGTDIDPWSAKDIAVVCDRLKIPYARTDKGNPSFEQSVLDHATHPFLKSLRQLRRYDSLRSRFVEGLILSNHINGRVHCQFHQLKGDEDGVRGGRFSSTKPNLQQVPARDPDLAPLIRGLFIPDDGCKWAKLDYSQQEPRILVHYAYLCKFVGADVARQVWVKEPTTDFYKYIAEVAEVVRKDAKTIYLGRSYGMGKVKLAEDLNRTLEAAALILEKFDERNPYVAQLAEKCMKQVQRTGKIRTIGGRLCHFDFWVRKSTWDNEKKCWSRRYDVPVKGYEKAQTHWPEAPLERAFTHKALNRLIQGSAGDMTKMAIIKNYEDLGAVAHLTVHDELDHSVPDMRYALRLKHNMETCVDMTVPIVAELEYLEAWK
jgi:DNA polymerase I-like protein with 3'-5' exonuclease and polymerase domains